MASLSPGVIVKLFKDMNSDEKVVERRSVLLQVRSIIPALADGDLWPKQGFYLEVSDSSHSTYVALPHDQDEMILSDKLHLGQLIYVQKLEAASLVPIVRGLRPVPGPYPCIGNSEHLINTVHSPWLRGPIISDLDLAVKNNHTEKKTQRKPRSLSASRIHSNDLHYRKALDCQSIWASHTNSLYKRSNRERKTPDILKGSPKITSIDRDSDSDSSKSSCSSRPKSTRRSWDESMITRIKGRSTSQFSKHEMKPIARSRSACVFPPIHDCSDVHAVYTLSRKRDTYPAPRVIKTEYSIQWGSLPSSLVKLGKEVLRHRDAALLAAVEALQEASAAERLVQCLSIYSELQSSEGDDPQPTVDKFLDLHDNLSHSVLIVQSLAKTSPIRTSDTYSGSPVSVEALKLALERKKHAASWIKAAVASDLSPFIPITNFMEAVNEVKKSGSTSHCKPKSSCIVSKGRKDDSISVGVVSTKDNPPDWVKGSSLSVAADLSNSLQGECRRWFLTYVEKFLDGVRSETASTASDCQVAAVMCQIKKVDDWLDVIVSKGANLPEDGCTDSPMLEDEMRDACSRVRNKIYRVLLKHVERSVTALENMNAITQG